MSVYQSGDGGKTYQPAEPLGWLEEHGPVARLILTVLGVGHCGKRGWRR